MKTPTIGTISIRRSALYLALMNVFLTPFMLHAADAPTNLQSFVQILSDLMMYIVVLLLALTLLAFMWGLIKGWVIGGGDAEGVESGKKVVVVGIIALVIMSAIWGILNLLQSSLFGNL